MEASHEAPGVVIHHVPAATRNYVGCPSIVVLPSGRYVASHSYFGPGSTYSESFVYHSDDRGSTWRRVAHVTGQIWSKLFLHHGSLYFIGTDHCDNNLGRLNGKVVIRRSDDDGLTWTTPDRAGTGLLAEDDGYHTAPTPLVVHDGRVWKAFEFAPEPDRRSWTVLVLSAPADADLLDRSAWRFSEQLAAWPGYQWIEGNMVVGPDGSLVDVLRTNDRNKPNDRLDRDDEPAAMVHVSDDGRALGHDPERDRLDFPGGGAKFTIKRDPASGSYYALVNPQDGPDLYRNILSLSSSSDLRSWTLRRELLRHPDQIHHAFQYVDWDFDGEDIVFASRTAYDDALGGAHRAHDANFLTFGRVERFAAHDA